MNVTISHDPFGRYSIIRRRAEGDCAWCGAPARWQYGAESDGFGARPQWQSEVFCSRGCSRAFHGEADR